jgi:putative ABC transport system permease protein
MKDASKKKADRAGFSCFVRLLFQHLRAFRWSHALVVVTMAIGAMAMSATFFVGDGATAHVWKDMEKLLGSQIMIIPDPGPDGALLKRRASVSFVEADLAALRARVTCAKRIVPHIVQRARLVANGADTAVMLEGMSPELSAEKAFQPVEGRAFSTGAVNGDLHECLVTESLAGQLSLKGGERISVDGHLFAVVGVIPDPPMADTRFKSRVVVPYVFAHWLYGKPGFYDSFAAIWQSPETFEKLLEQIRDTLDSQVGVDCYWLSSSLLTARNQKRIVANVMVFGSAQAFFCVLVASIGVANVMLATVVRRRREYAIRVAMGARQRDIFGLVLAESLLLGLSGGALGVLAAAAVSPLICQVVANHIRTVAALAPQICPRGVLISLGACGFCGLLAGVFPALQVRRMDVLSNLYAE